ncbi:trafficking kinesin-binding protein 1-like isoform X2 [Carassius auratus]|uniref:Trafficking kinesin-binding protein 1-like isoform X2 n=1 Tax=Carassius auratus TaxID=7957 RepID=A0A6P6LTN8_CARAU|nr:trafficking kinesin-binding protein 1-like isoform X2 [Carassius auratus]
MTHLSRPHERMATFFPSDVCQRRSSRMPCSNIPKCPFQGLVFFQWVGNCVLVCFNSITLLCHENRLGWRWRKQGRTQRIRLFTVLCAERVGQMTKTYNDIDAVTRLLEEKDWDLELAARIGQSLLKRNRVLSEQNEYLEEQVGTIREEAHEQIHYNVQMKVSNSPLHHELNLKDELLQFYTNAVEESEEGSGSPTRQQGRAGVSAHSGSSLDFLNFKTWRRKISLSDQRAVQHPDLQYSRRTGQKNRRCLSPTGGNHTPSLSDSRPAEKIQNCDSLAAEIEGTKRKELSLENPDNEEQRVHHTRVFETEKNINQSVRQRSAISSTKIPGSNQTLSSLSSALSDSSGNDTAPDNHKQSVLQETGSSDAAVDAPEKRSGSEQLQLALRRLSLRRQNCLSERLFFERERERCNLDPADGADNSNRLVHSESIMSLGAWASRPYLPDKLQIVKPLEGSATLQHWQQLAQPNLGGILDARPGVVPKGFRPLELELEEVYQYADYEEDEPGEQYFQNLPTTTTSSPSVPPGHSLAPSASPSPCLSTGHTSVGFSMYFTGKCMAHTCSTYTFTTCKILHPSDELTRVTPSLNPVPTSSCVMSSSLRSTPAATPCTPRRMSLSQSQSQSFTNLRDSTKTFSTSLGPVCLLQERGISAAVYQPHSWDRGSGGVLYSTSVLPPPPPDQIRPTTPPHSPICCTPSPISAVSDVDISTSFSFKSPSYENFLASKPARSILKEVARVSGGQAKDCESQINISMYNLNLVDKLKRLGLAIPGASGARGGGVPRPSSLIGPLGGLRRAGSPFSPLNEGMRRKWSVPAMVGASMAMKGRPSRGQNATGSLTTQENKSQIMSYA